MIYFETFSAPTADTLFLLVLSILTLESVHSIRFLYQHFLSGITTKSLNTFYHACSYAKVDYSHFMNITAKVALRMIPDSLAKLFQPYFSEGAAIVNISSSRDRMSQPQTESYTAAKGGISALTHALAVSFAGRVRVNSISPGWIDTDFTEYTGADAVQQPVHRVGNPMDIANMVLFLCSEKAGFITGENICIDGGMTKQMIYHGDYG